MNGKDKAALLYLIAVMLFMLSLAALGIYQDTHKAPTNQQCAEVVK